MSAADAFWGADEDDLQFGGESTEEDICRVCRAGASAGRPLFYPCLCTGSIRYIHQDCLMQWLKHSGKEYCELCNHKFQFAPIYKPDMPHRLSFRDFIEGVMSGITKDLRYYLHLGFVAFMWLFIVPICIYRIYKFLLYGSFWSVARFPFDLFSLDNLIIDEIYGLVVVLVSLVGFVSLVWLKDQLRNGIAPAWLENDRRELVQGGANVLDEEGMDQGIQGLQQGIRVVEVRRAIADLEQRLQEQVSELEKTLRKADEKQMEELEINRMELVHAVNRRQWQYETREILLNALNKKRDAENAATAGREQQQAAADEHGFGVYPWLPRLDADMPAAADGDDDGNRAEEENILTKMEAAVLRLHNSAPVELEDIERATLMEEIRGLHQAMKDILVVQQLEQEKCLRLSYIIGDQEERHEMEEMLPEVQASIRSIRQTRAALSRQQDVLEELENGQGVAGVAGAAGGGGGEQQQQQQQQQARPQGQGQGQGGNHWFNRLRRRQEEPAPGARLRAQPQPPPAAAAPAPAAGQPQQRPNIGRALAGLARDQDNGNAERGNEELTWARLLGLDGSFRFLEHVVWLICLNSALIFTFIYLPYQVGWMAASAISLWKWVNIVTWKGVVATFLGYVLSSLVVVLLYYGAGMARVPRVRSFLGFTYVAIKVTLVLFVEAGLFPVMSGWWLDICAFGLFGSSMKGRQESLQSAPGTVMFLHWLAGMIFVFYFASFVILLREILRPGVLWFLRNLNDQNFHPIQEMIGLPFTTQLRRFIMSCFLFGLSVVVVLLLPTKIISYLFPSFLPFNLTLMNSVSPIREVQLELILLQFVIPTLLEHGNSRAGLKIVIRHWAKLAAHLFGLKSYFMDFPQSGGYVVDLNENLLREIPYNPDVANQEPPYTGPLQVLGPGFAPFKPYLRPYYFFPRIVGLLIFTCATGILFSAILLTVPVFTGRQLMSLVGVSGVPDIYTAAIGFYATWLACRASSTLLHYFSQGVTIFLQQCNIWALQILKCWVAGVLLFIVVPLLMGHLVDLVLIIPLRVPLDRTPLFYSTTEWALGLLHMKCTCGAIWLGNSGFKRKLDQMYMAGMRNLNLTFVVKEIAWPVILLLSLCITVPYTFFFGVLQGFGFEYRFSLLLYRCFFPIAMLYALVMVVVFLVTNHCIGLYNQVKDDKYLIGRQLVNIDNDEKVDSEEYVVPVQETGEQ